MEPWGWCEETWRQRVGKVRAGRSLKPASWKGGARCAVALSFDCDHETSELVLGGNSIGRLSAGEYGSRVGVPRILNTLKRNGISATFFIPAVSALLHEDEARRIVGDGHEIGIHGWIHEFNSILAHEVERELQCRAADTLERVSGQRPLGMRTPSWDFSQHTLQIAQELGLIYDSSLMADDDPYELLGDGVPTGIIELPVEWIRDDGVYFNMDLQSALRPQMSPMAVLDVFRREFDQAWGEGGLFLLTMHPHVIGHRSRMFILEELIAHITSRSDVWVATHGDVARYLKEMTAT
ncbi:MAG: polysaccharide deacetylase, partial [Mesorhizobium sp.]